MLPSSCRNSAGYTHVPSSEAVRLEPEPSVEMSTISTPSINVDIDIDPTYINPTSEVPTIANLLNDVTKIQSRKRAKPAPTLATGRRNLKNEKVSEEEARKRCKRRDSNRMSAQRSREKRNQIAMKLELELLRLQKANQVMRDNTQMYTDVIRHAEDQLGHTCITPSLPYIESVQPQPQQPSVAILSQPMSASSCGSECPVSNTSQGLTPPPLSEDIMIKHSPPDTYEQQTTLSMRPNNLTIPTINPVPVSTDQSYLEQLHLAEPQGPNTATTYFQTSFSDTLSTPVMSYGYNSIEFGHNDISVMPQMTDSDPMNLP